MTVNMENWLASDLFSLSKGAAAGFRLLCLSCFKKTFPRQTQDLKFGAISTTTER